MEYTVVPSSDELQKGEDFVLSLRLQNTANAPRTFTVIHNTGVTDAKTTKPYNISIPDLRQKETYITANTSNQDTECSTKPAPYFGRWRTFCKYVLAPNEERTIEYPFTVGTDFDCTSSLFASAELETAVMGYKKTIERYARVFPNNCGFGASTSVSCVPLAALQSLQKRYVNAQFSKDKSFVTYTVIPDGDGVSRTLHSLDVLSCTEKLIAEVDKTTAIGEVHVSNANDILYEIVEWYVASGHPKRALYRIDGVTGESQVVASYAPKNTGVGSLDLSADGSRAVFVATWVDLQTNSNADLSTELYLWENGVITQLTECTPENYERYNDCILANPRFTDESGRYVTIQTDYNPKTGEPHEPRFSTQYYKYDIEEGKFL